MSWKYLGKHYKWKEDEQDVKEAKRIMKRIKSGKEKLYSKKQFNKKTGLKV